MQGLAWPWEGSGRARACRHGGWLVSRRPGEGGPDGRHMTPAMGGRWIDGLLSCAA